MVLEHRIKNLFGNSRRRTLCNAGANDTPQICQKCLKDIKDICDTLRKVSGLLVSLNNIVIVLLSSLDQALLFFIDLAVGADKSQLQKPENVALLNALSQMVADVALREDEDWTMAAFPGNDGSLSGNLGS